MWSILSEYDTWLMLKMYSISQRKLDLLVKIICFSVNLWKLELSVAGELINILYIAIAYYKVHFSHHDRQTIGWFMVNIEKYPT